MPSFKLPSPVRENHGIEDEVVGVEDAVHGPFGLRAVDRLTEICGVARGARNVRSPISS